MNKFDRVRNTVSKRTGVVVEVHPTVLHVVPDDRPEVTATWKVGECRVVSPRVEENVPLDRLS